MKDPKIWDVIAWVSFILGIITTLIYFFVDEGYTESPTWILVSIAAWYYSDHLEDKKSEKV
ncbi:hypothetical protein [Pseudoalteromonas sp. T1lg24]|uniref:hypothetical protein n=1 Tax=Pseudoalteromonas sp. T1lg24 TaxID=2077099 RepID=UPI000CF68E8C|nr:hypothetical protein [Pseudoalteromonas sp. T1lg24]